jgi:hypothetical protein
VTSTVLGLHCTKRCHTAINKLLLALTHAHITTGYSSYTTHAEARLQDKESALRRREHRVQRAEALVKEERDRLEATKQEVCLSVCVCLNFLDCTACMQRQYISSRVRRV